MSIFPFVGDFYEDMQAKGEITLPEFPLLVGVEFLRGFVFVASMMPFIRIMAGRPWRAALNLSMCLVVLGGVAGLLQPNEILPPFVRGMHMIEIGVSNFIFAVISAHLLVRR